MTYGEIKKQSLQLAFSDSIAGDTIPESYNNQADYVAMIPQLVNSAEMEIATTVKKLPESVALVELEKLSGQRIYSLPADLYKIMDGGLFFYDEDGIKRIKPYRVLAGKKLVLFEDPDPGLILEYWRFPQYLSDDPADDEEPDNTPDTHYAIPFYVAAHLILYDDTYRYTALISEWERRLARLREGMVVEGGLVGNAYV